MVGKPRRMFEHEGDAVAVDRLQPVAPDDRRHQPRMDRLALRRAVDIVLEIGQHLEMLADIRIEGGQEVIEQPVAEQDHLDVERDGVGLERDRAGQADEAPDILDPDLALAQRPLQRRTS